MRGALLSCLSAWFSGGALWGSPRHPGETGSVPDAAFLLPTGALLSHEWLAPHLARLPSRGTDEGRRHDA